MTTPDEPILIQPAKAPLSDSGSRRHRSHRISTRRNTAPRVIGFGIAMLVLGTLAAFVFVYLPQRVEAPAPPDRVGEPASENGRLKATKGDVVPPFEAADLVNTRKQAEAKLAEFFELENRLEEQLNVTAWGAEDLDRIKDRASAGDQIFMEGRYQESLDAYAAAVRDLAGLADKGNALYDAAIERGQSGLAELDPRTAVEAFERALTVRPNDRQATSGLERAASLPEIIELLRQSDRAVLRGEYAAAGEYLAQVGVLDPATAGLDDRAAEIADARAIERRRATLSEGFGALERGEHDPAIDAFNRVLKDDPNDADGLAGLQQAKQAKLLAEIDRLQSLAERQESEDQWTDALATYDAVLAIDPSLRFARDGKARIAARVGLLESMATFIDDPGMLSDENQYARARDVLTEASADTGAGPMFQAQVEELRAIVERSSVAVLLTIESDNETEIMIQKVGVVGTFLRRELMLRPGRYVIVGSRDGYRDVRDEIILEPDSDPVQIRCTEPIQFLEGAES